MKILSVFKKLNFLNKSENMYELLMWTSTTIHLKVVFTYFSNLLLKGNFLIEKNLKNLYLKIEFLYFFFNLKVSKNESG